MANGEYLKKMDPAISDETINNYTQILADMGMGPENDSKYVHLYYVANGKDSNGRSLSPQELMSSLKNLFVVNYNRTGSSGGKENLDVTLDSGKIKGIRDSTAKKRMMEIMSNPDLTGEQDSTLGGERVRYTFKTFDNKPEASRDKAAQLNDFMLSTDSNYSSDNLNTIYDKVGQGLSTIDIDEYLKTNNIQPEQTVDATADATASGAYDATTAPVKVQEMINNLGLTDKLSQDALDYLTDELATGRTPYEIEVALKGMPEYTELQSEAEQARAKEEAANIQAELGTQLQQETEKGLAAMTPRLEQTYKRLGGTNRESLSAALATTAKSLGEQRQSILGQAGIESMVQQAGFNREDYLSVQNQTYQRAMQQYEQDYQSWLMDKQTSNQLQYQKALYPLQMAATRQGQAFQVDQTESARQYQDFWQNQQRQWAKEDQAFYAKLQKQQNWANLFGAIGGIGLGGGLGALAGVGFGKGALSSLSGFNAFTKD